MKYFIASDGKGPKFIKLMELFFGWVQRTSEKYTKVNARKVVIKLRT